MTTRNLRILLIVVIASLFCYANAERARSLGDLALAMEIIDREYVRKPDREKLYQAAMKGTAVELTVGGRHPQRMRVGRIARCYLRAAIASIAAFLAPPFAIVTNGARR